MNSFIRVSVFLVAGFLSRISLVRGGEYTTETCCEYGQAAAKSFSNISHTVVSACFKPSLNYSQICQYAFSSCCFQSLQMGYCKKGIEFSLREDSESCNDISFSNALETSISRQCCMCCELQAEPSSHPFTNNWCGYASDYCREFLNSTEEEESNGNQTAIENNFEDIVNFNETVNSTSDAEQTTQTATASELICESEYHWNSNTKLCEKIIISCPKLYYLNKTLGHCVEYGKELLDCEKGYQHNRLTLKCEDIDECAENLTTCHGKEYVCVNKPGKYQCMCQTGYRRHRISGACVDIDECSYNLHNCIDGQRCQNKDGSFKCVRIIGCGYGYNLDDDTQECIDVNECEKDKDPCGFGMDCFNLPGSFSCKEKKCDNGLIRNMKTGTCDFCEEGYRYDNSTKLCMDINECENPHICKKHQVCENIPGSYQCRNRVQCSIGTRLSSNGLYCEDINECLEERHECEEPYVCHNAEGTYFCRLNPCNSRQRFDKKSETCKCKKGFELKEEVCEDIDECKQAEKPICKPGFECVNTFGSHYCKRFSRCRVGFRRPNNFTSCEDIDECATKNHGCDENAVCMNVPGSYQCVCKRGFRKNERGYCEDVNECEMMNVERICRGKHLRCENALGTYHCKCEVGFRAIGWTKFCEDINECAENKTICGKHTCVNTEGSYTCRCRLGYTSDSNRKTCVDIDECKVYGRSICRNSRCFNYEGSYSCKCPTGYMMNNRETCSDIDECLTRGRCPAANQRCINLEGSFRCVTPFCRAGYILQNIARGFECINNNPACRKGDTLCTRRFPKQINNLFIEVSNDVGFPHKVHDIETSTTSDNFVGHNINIVYAKHATSGKDIDVTGSFRLTKRSTLYHTTVSIVIMKALPVPSDILIELRKSVFSQIYYHQLRKPRRLHSYDTVSYINVYLTKKLSLEL